jgi:hypothetical protein
MIARAALLLALLLGGVAAAGAQAPAHRFFVDSVADSTFVFHVSGGAEWLRAGQTGIAVDPRRRDALVARFRVLAVDRARVTALVTGQTTVLTRDHVALMAPPRQRFYRDAGFWAGTILGTVLGAVAALAF